MTLRLSAWTCVDGRAAPPDGASPKIQDDQRGQNRMVGTSRPAQIGLCSGQQSATHETEGRKIFPRGSIIICHSCGPAFRLGLETGFLASSARFWCRFFRLQTLFGRLAPSPARTPNEHPVQGRQPLNSRSIPDVHEPPGW